MGGTIPQSLVPVGILYGPARCIGLICFIIFTFIDRAFDKQLDAAKLPDAPAEEEFAQ